jgi:hypothetical protein
MAERVATVRIHVVRRRHSSWLSAARLLGCPPSTASRARRSPRAESDAIGSRHFAQVRRLGWLVLALLGERWSVTHREGFNGRPTGSLSVARTCPFSVWVARTGRMGSLIDHGYACARTTPTTTPCAGLCPGSERPWAAGVREPEAAIATASADGVPSVRMALVKAFDERGFVFFSSYNSHKGREIAANPTRSSQLSALASPQSQTIDSRDELTVQARSRAPRAPSRLVRRGEAEPSARWLRSRAPRVGHRRAPGGDETEAGVACRS